MFVIQSSWIRFGLGFLGVLVLTFVAPKTGLGGGDPVKFPAHYDKGVLYTTVHRGNITEELYTGQEAIEAVKRGDPLPSGTVITLVDYRDDKLYRYVVMEKRAGWGHEYPP